MIALAPLIVFEHPAFTDHPNHLARLHVRVAEADSPLRAVLLGVAMLQRRLLGALDPLV